jgi:hypothetical protein
MAAKKEPGISWRHTTVLVRADIFENAREQGLDISDTCNRALADLLGIDYRQQRLDDVPVPPPVIIAKDGALPAPALPATALHTTLRPPVINADDPTAAGAIARIRKTGVKKPVPDAASRTTKSAEEAVPEPPVKKTRTRPSPGQVKAAAKKTQKGDGLKKFIATKIVRDDAEEALIPKEELYQIFSRWCREQKITQVPDQKSVTVALKTRFAFKEKSAGGSPCWAGLRVR